MKKVSLCYIYVVSKSHISHVFLLLQVALRIILYIKCNMIHARSFFCTCVILSRKASFSKSSLRWIQSLHLLELPLTLVPYFETALLKHSCGKKNLHCLIWQVHWPRVFLPLIQEEHTSLTSPSGRSHTWLNSLKPFSWLQTAQRFRSQSWHSTFVDRENHWSLEKSSLTLDFLQLSHVLDKQSLHSQDPVGFDFSDLSKLSGLRAFLHI